MGAMAGRRGKAVAAALFLLAGLHERGKTARMDFWRSEKPALRETRLASAQEVNVRSNALKPKTQNGQLNRFARGGPTNETVRLGVRWTRWPGPRFRNCRAPLLATLRRCGPLQLRALKAFTYLATIRCSKSGGGKHTHTQMLIAVGQQVRDIPLS